MIQTPDRDWVSTGVSEGTGDRSRHVKLPHRPDAGGCSVVGCDGNEIDGGLA